MQLVPGWEKEAKLDLRPILKSLFMCHCAYFLHKAVEMARETNNITPDFIAHVLGMLKLWKPMGDILEVPLSPELDQLTERLIKEFEKGSVGGDRDYKEGGNSNETSE